MPKLNPLKGIKLENIKEGETKFLGHKIGQGAEKEIYLSKDNDVIAILKYLEDSPEAFKGRYYLTKILHYIFPQNIPDIYAVFYDRNSVLRIEFKNLEKEYIQLIADLYFLNNYPIHNDDIESLSIRYQKRKEKIIRDPNYIDLINKLKECGVLVDGNFLNFSYDNNGNLVYIDNSFIPWSTDNKKNIFSINYNYNNLKKMIEEKLQKENKDRALRYLQRLEELKKQYENSLKKTN